jgi:hypothetical protein
MVRALAGVRWGKMLANGVQATIEDLARAKDVNPTYVSRILRLTLLAPEIVEATLDGGQPAAMQLDDLLKGFSPDWEGQRALAAASGTG